MNKVKKSIQAVYNKLKNSYHPLDLTKYKYN